MIIAQIPYQNPINLLIKLPATGLAFLDSSMIHQTLGRYSYIGVDPFACLTLARDTKNTAPFDQINAFLDSFTAPQQPDLPPFQGGLIGYFAYDLAFLLEPSIKTTPKQHFACHYYQLGCFDLSISFDHQQKKAWIVSTGFPETTQHQQKIRAKKRLQWLQAILEKKSSNTADNIFHKKIDSNIAVPQPYMHHREYIEAVNRIMDYIRAGDIFQANLARCYQMPLNEPADAISLYCTLRETNPAPFAALLNFLPCRILSSSPERFLKLNNGQVETRPIKGTINRSNDPVKDKILASQLIHSEKDRAENTMIVDLMRNDLSRVCLADSIKVKQLCQLESYQNVHHLVSIVTGRLKPQLSAIDLLAAAFPGGSITGAPKIRAIEIIDALETSARGPYCGAIGYIGFNGQMDTSIAIRTLLLNDQQLLFHSGGAITQASIPEQEYQETLVKASMIKKAIALSFNLRRS